MGLQCLRENSHPRQLANLPTREAAPTRQSYIKTDPHLGFLLVLTQTLQPQRDELPEPYQPSTGQGPA